MNVLRSDGQVEQFQLAEIDSITFDANEAADGAVRSNNDILRVHLPDGIHQFPVAVIDSLAFAAGNVLTIYQGPIVLAQFNLVEVDSMTFASSAETIVDIVYDGETATADNPLDGAGVTVEIAGADVTVTAAAGLDGITYVLSGATPDGMFKIYSDGDFTLQLDGVEIANQDGPAINVQADETIAVVLVDGTTSTLTDGVTYADPPGDEDQKAAFFSEGQLLFSGTGRLVVHGQGDDQHGLGSDDYVEIFSGDIVVASAVKDGIHTNEGFYLRGGSAEVTSGSDGVDAGDGPVAITGGTLSVLSQDDDRDALKCDGELAIAGGVVDLTVEGDQSKGLNAADILLTGGTLTIQTSGGVVLEESGVGYDPSYCTAIKGDDQVLLDGCQVTIVTGGEAGRGISCDGDILVRSGSLSITSSGDGDTYTDETGALDAYHGPCLKADGDVVLSGGSVTLVHSGDGGRGITTDAGLTIDDANASPTLQITTTGQPITIGWNDAFEAKAVKADSMIAISAGEITIAAADDGIKSKYWIEITGGLIDIQNSVEGLEAPNLIIAGGEIHVRSSDDGLNATYGNDIEGDDGSDLIISGGYVHVSASGGDAIDSNGSFTVSGGVLVAHGPPSQPEVGVDVNGAWIVSGGFMVVSAINSNMMEAPSGLSSQRSVRLRSNQYFNAGTLIHVEDTAGNSLFTFAPERRYSGIIFSSSELSAGTTYRVYTGGTCSGEEQDGLYAGGTYSGGSLRTTFTSSGMVQTVSF